MNTKSAITALAALAQESRLAVFRLLVATGPQGLAASKIAETLAVPASSLSFYLKELTHAELITAMQDLMDFLSANCSQGEPCGLRT